MPYIGGSMAFLIQIFMKIPVRVSVYTCPVFVAFIIVYVVFLKASRAYTVIKM